MFLSRESEPQRVQRAQPRARRLTKSLCAVRDRLGPLSTLLRGDEKPSITFSERRDGENEMI